jgi:iron complex outermembrane receptor protein
MAKIRRHALRGVVCMLLVSGASRVLAQAQNPSPAEKPATKTDNPSGRALEDIVVTARKTTENLQKAPASIVAVSGDALATAQITSAIQLEKVLPSANLREEGAVTQVFIRGVGSVTDLPNFAASSVYTFNGITIPRYGTGGLLFDLSSVQEISGPQGTLYGGSAAGGAINVNSAKPVNDFSGSGLLEAGNYGAIHTSLDQNIPLGEKASFRGAIDYERHEGYESGGIDAENQIAGRASLRVAPSDDLNALLFLNAVHINGKPNTAGVTNPTSSDPWHLPDVGPDGNPINASTTFNDNTYYVVGANIEKHLGDNNTITWIPGFVHVADDYNILGPTFAFALQLHDREAQHTEELKWAGHFGKLTLNAGLFYLRNRINFNYGLNLAVLPAPTYYAFAQLNTTDQTNTSYAAYGQAVYAATDRLRFTAGVRGSSDKIQASGTDASGPYDFNHKQKTVDWKAGVDFDVAPHLLVYANVQTGYVPFGYNPATNPAEIVPRARLRAYSGGFKSRFLDNRFEINDEIFYYDYRHFQAIDFIATTAMSTVLNAEKATNYGNDFHLRARLTETTNLDVSYVYLHARFNQFQGVGYDYTGNRLVDAPGHNVIASLQQTLHLAPGDIIGRVSTQYNSGYYGDFTNDPGSRQRAYTRTDLSLTYAPHDSRWTVQLFAHNLENAAVFGTLNGVGGPTTEIGSGLLGPPRTYGVQLSASW